ncbi:MAG: nuclear transport factor 2 family protein, partial [Halobacteriales archaeon]|nr:nuclear transport factor 2 family protein [Halobacteriales archaeon]
MARRTPPIEDYLAILQLKHEYCYRIDDKDYEAWIDLFTEDGVFGITGIETFEGKSELRQFAESVFDEEYTYTAHIVTNPRIEIDGETASGQWY